MAWLEDIALSERSLHRTSLHAVPRQASWSGLLHTRAMKRGYQGLEGMVSCVVVTDLQLVGMKRSWMLLVHSVDVLDTAIQLSWCRPARHVILVLETGGRKITSLKFEASLGQVVRAYLERKIKSQLKKIN